MLIARRLRLAAALSILAGAALSCASPAAKTPATTSNPAPTASAPTPTPTPPAKPAPVAAPRVADVKPRDYPGIHNLVAFHEAFISGSVPEGAAGFDSLAGMGIKTIISVDGAAPEVNLAEARGMRYIHLPIGYNGFDEKRKLELTRATRDAMKDGPVYIHCHHGKHRSAGAAATVAASLGWATPAAGVERMKVSGTAPNYKGLYACATNATVLSPNTLDALSGDFPSTAPPAGFVKGMIEMDEIMDHLKAVEKANWGVPADHPDLIPAAEAGRLADLLRVHAEGDRAKRQPAGFAAGLRSNSDIAQALEDLLAAGEKDKAKLSAQFKLVAASCKDCHTKFRD